MQYVLKNEKEKNVYEYLFLRMIIDKYRRIFYNKNVIRFDCDPIWGKGLMHKVGITPLG